VFTNGDNRSAFLEDAPPHILYLWHKADTDPGVLGNMLQILGVAVAADCDNIPVDCSQVTTKRKVAAEKSEEELKEQSKF
jgi:hypothetical protein